MAKKKKKKSIQLDVGSFKDGQAKALVNVNGNFILTDLNINNKANEYASLTNEVESASLVFDRTQNLYSRIIETEEASYVTTTDDLLKLAQNTQNDIDKIIEINGIAQYYINKDDIIGKVIEIINNNVNTNYKNNFPNLSVEDKDQKELKEEIELLLKKFNEEIDLKEFILDCVISTYVQGTYIPYLRGDATKGYVIETYPLGILQVTSLKIDNEPVISFNVEDLKSSLRAVQNEFGKLKSNKIIDLTNGVEEEVKRNYPDEIIDAYMQKDKICFLNPKRVGISRINNLKGLYGLTPIFKSLNSQLMLDTFETVDRKNALAKSKKIYHQVLRKELLGEDYKNIKHGNEITYAHTLLSMAMQKDTVLITSPAYVEKIEILEPKVKETDANTIVMHRNRVLNALGIGYLSNEVKSSYNTITVNVEELLKLVNKIIKQTEKIINKFYKVMCEDNGIDVIYAPTIAIQSTKYLSTDDKNKLIDLLYSKLGASYKTVFNALGEEYDFDSEVRNRIEEKTYLVDGKEYNLDEVFIPHSTSFNSSGSDGSNSGSSDSSGSDSGSDTIETIDDDNNKEDNVQNPDKEKQAQDKERYKNQKAIK